MTERYWEYPRDTRRFAFQPGDKIVGKGKYAGKEGTIVEIRVRVKESWKKFRDTYYTVELKGGKRIVMQGGNGLRKAENA